MSREKSYIVYLILSVFPVFLFIIVPVKMWHQSEFVLTSLEYPIYWGLALVGVVGLYLNQSRIFLSALLFLGAYFLNLHPTVFHEMGLDQISLKQILSFVMPLSLLLFFSVKESRFWNSRSLLRVVLAVLPTVTMVMWLWLDPKTFHYVASFEVLPFNTSAKLPPQLALIGFGVYVVATMVSEDNRVVFFRWALGFCLLNLVLSQYASFLQGSKLNSSTYALVSFGVVTVVLLSSLLTMLWERVYLDELTGVPNRRALDERMERLDQEYSLLVIDVDHFKKFNDTYGHLEGDNVLRHIARTLSYASSGAVYRFGGEEFCIVLPKLDCLEAADVAEDLRVAVEEGRFVVRKTQRKSGAWNLRGPWSRGQLSEFGEQAVAVTVSIGVASPVLGRRLKYDVFKAADQALYRAKEKGRNCVEVNEEVPISSIVAVTAASSNQVFVHIV